MKKMKLTFGNHFIILVLIKENTKGNIVVKKIMVIDDSPVIRKVANNFLEKEGYKGIAEELGLNVAMDEWG